MKREACAGAVQEVGALAQVVGLAEVVDDEVLFEVVLDAREMDAAEAARQHGGHALGVIALRPADLDLDRLQTRIQIPLDVLQKFRQRKGEIDAAADEKLTD